MIAFTCPKCNNKLQRADAEAGTKVPCPACNQKLRVPTPARLVDQTMAGVLVPQMDSPDLPAHPAPASAAGTQVSLESDDPAALPGLFRQQRSIRFRQAIRKGLDVIDLGKSSALRFCVALMASSLVLLGLLFASLLAGLPVVPGLLVGLFCFTVMLGVSAFAAFGPSDKELAKLRGQLQKRIATLQEAARSAALDVLEPAPPPPPARAAKPFLPVAELYAPPSHDVDAGQESLSVDDASPSSPSRSKPPQRNPGDRSLISFSGLARGAAVLFLGFVLLSLVIVGVQSYNSSSKAARELADLNTLRTTPELKGRLEAAFAVQSTYTRDQLLEGIAKDAAAKGEVEVVKLALSKLDSQYTRDRFAKEAALRLTDKGDTQGATEVARLISSSYSRDQVLEKIAKASSTKPSSTVSGPSTQRKDSPIVYDPPSDPAPAWNDRPPPPRQPAICPVCKGSGLSTFVCSSCRGTGVDSTGTRACFACKGKRFGNCVSCNGRGQGGYFNP